MRTNFQINCYPQCVDQGYGQQNKKKVKIFFGVENESKLELFFRKLEFQRFNLR